MTVWTELGRPPHVAPELLCRDRVATSTWVGLLRDGAYRALHPAWALRADLQPAPAWRARVLAARVPARAVVGREAAVWVHAGGVAPARLDVLVAPGARRVEPDPDRHSHEATLGPGDVVGCGGVPVTSIARTGLDVARWCPAERAEPLLHGLLPLGFDPHVALAALADVPRGRGVRGARDVLSAVAAVRPG